jgi:hypothetical protein
MTQQGLRWMPRSLLNCGQSIDPNEPVALLTDQGLLFESLGILFDLDQLRNPTTTVAFFYTEDMCFVIDQSFLDKNSLDKGPGAIIFSSVPPPGTARKGVLVAVNSHQNGAIFVRRIHSIMVVVPLGEVPNDWLNREGFQTTLTSSEQKWFVD